MERAISEMERIKRAEEIYAKRKSINEEAEGVRKRRSIYKYLFHGLVLINIAIVIVAVQNKNSIFTQGFIEQVSSYNVNLKETIENIFSVKAEDVNNENSKKEEQENEGSQNNENQQANGESNSQNIEENVDSLSQNQPGDAVPGESNTVQGAALVENEPQRELSQMEKDVISIKEKYSVILPLSGTKTSSFGGRESTNSKVTSNHTGVDIAAEYGTVINSAITGKVIQVSALGDYGKHLRIATDNLCVLYAHCSKIYVSEGDEISQGQPIAEVGSTGNSTGPHLHFEIKYEDRLVNPELILEI